MSATTSTSWTAALPPSMRGEALAVAHDVAIRCTDAERVRVALAAAREQTQYPQTVRWEPYGVAQGDAGLALLAGQLEATFPGEGWELRAHSLLATAARAAEQAAFPPPGAFSGLAGLAFTARRLSAGGTRYGRLRATLEQTLAALALRQAERLRTLAPGIGVSEFDLISGLSGILPTLLGLPACTGAAEAAAAALVELAGEHRGRPAWFTPPALMGDEQMIRRFPHGNLNCGLAHGIPGPLAALALARLEGIDVPGQAQAIAWLAGWLAAHRCDDAWGVNWPTAVDVANDEGDAPGRAAWCYGAPGVARALWLAGEALDDDASRTLAMEGIEAVLRRPAAARGIDSPTFCHGVAGLLHVVLRFAADSGTMAEAIEPLARQLLDAYDGERLLGYATLEPGGVWVDQPGLLDGAPGVALVLLAAGTDVEPAWDRLFLLS